MVDFIIKYWVEVLFGLICAGFGMFMKKFFQMMRNEYARTQQDIMDKIDSKLDNQSKNLNDKIDSYEKNINARLDEKLDQQEKKITALIDDRDKKLTEKDTQTKESLVKVQTDFNAMKDAMLSIQGRAFKEDCRKLLVQDHEISLSEYENINSEHTVYNKLGGNHDGDALFDLVKTKYTKHLAAGIREEE